MFFFFDLYFKLFIVNYYLYILFCVFELFVKLRLCRVGIDNFIDREGVFVVVFDIGSFIKELL